MADYSALNDPMMAEILESFLVETREILEKLDVDLMDLEERPDDKDLLNEIFRSFHTIKGTSGFLGLEKLQKVTHRCEDILNKLRKGEIKLNEEIMDAILLAYDTIKALIDVIEANKNEDYDTSEVVDKLTKIIEALNSGGGEASAASQEAPGEAPAEEQTQEQPAETERKEEVATTEPQAAPEETAQSEDAKSEEKEKEKAESAEKTEEPREEPPKEESGAKTEVEKPAETAAPPKEEKKPKQPAAPPQTHAKKVDSTIRVEVERLDDLLNIVQELVLGRNRLLQVNNTVLKEFEGSEISRALSEATQQIDLMTTELQLAVMKTRMVKIGKVFNRFPRVIRDLSKMTGKKVHLEIVGEETELDKTLIEEINDPLVHMVRNSVDHGIEPPEEREKLGKDPTGTIILSAEQEGNNIIISIEDDGRGIDPEKIKAKAIEKGIVTPEKAAEMSKNDILNLIFAPGFSTAQKVSNVSGRGVGMDVVKTNVTKLRGVINIETEPGKGSKFIIKLPITLAIIQGLLVQIDTEIVVIPLNTVIEVVRVSHEDIYMIGSSEVIKLRETVIPLVDLKESLYKKGPSVENDWHYIVIVGIAEKRFGLKVDKLLGQEEIVIKSLGKYLGNIKGIAGSTIMGDGTVVMIADIADIVTQIEDAKDE